MSQVERYMEGTEEALARALAANLRSGVLVSVRRLPAPPGAEVAALVTLRARPVAAQPAAQPAFPRAGIRRPPPARRSRVRVVAWCVGLTVTLAAAVGAAFAIWAAAAWAADHAAELLGAVVLLGLAALWLTSLGGGGGSHCPGPWHR